MTSSTRFISAFEISHLSCCIAQPPIVTAMTGIAALVTFRRLRRRSLCSLLVCHAEINAAGDRRRARAQSHLAHRFVALCRSPRVFLCHRSIAHPDASLSAVELLLLEQLTAFVSTVAILSLPLLAPLRHLSAVFCRRRVKRRRCTSKSSICLSANFCAPPSTPPPTGSFLDL